MKIREQQLADALAQLSPPPSPSGGGSGWGRCALGARVPAELVLGECPHPSSPQKREGA